MRKVLVLVAAIAAASCGGNQGSLSQEEAQSVGEAIASAISEAGAQSNAASGGSSRNLLSFGPITIQRSKACAGGGDVKASLTVSVSCSSGFWSCSTSGSSTVTAEACTTATGVVVDGALTGTFSGQGLNFSATVVGDLTITRPGEQPFVCTGASITVVGGKLVSGSNICGVAL